MSASQSTPARVLVADAISDAGIDLLRETPGFEVTVSIGMPAEELPQQIATHDALIVRSATKVTAEALANPGRLRAIGRAGTGVDNIDLAAATRAGVVVMNTPGGNSVAAAELTLAHLFALARHVPQANAALRAGEWARKRYVGVELDGKVLGVIGLGRIGCEVGRRARGLRMETLGYDPYVTAETAAAHGIELLPLEEVIERADVLTLHLPLTETTRHLIDSEMLKRMKPGARIINCARGGLIDEGALFDALNDNRLSGAALDVFEAEPPVDRRLVEHPAVVATPHLGASTREAQVRVGTEIAEKIRAYLQGGVILDAVNFPSIDREHSEAMGPVMNLAERLAGFLAQISEGGMRRLELRTFGGFNELSLKPLTLAAAKGLLTPIVSGGTVSYVNALELAGERGIAVEEVRSHQATPYAGLLRLSVETEQGTTSVAGTLFGADRLRLVEVDGVSIESNPVGHKLFIRNRDIPGVVGNLCTILGDAGINIAGIQLGRQEDNQDAAVSIIDTDAAVPTEALERIRAIDEILVARSVTL